MVDDAQSGGSASYGEFEDSSVDRKAWLRGNNECKAEAAEEGTMLKFVRAGSMMWIWDENQGTGLRLTSADMDFSEVDSQTFFVDGLLDEQSNKSVKCKKDSKDGPSEPPPGVNFYTIDDVLSGTFAEADAMALFQSSAALGS